MNKRYKIVVDPARFDELLKILRAHGINPLLTSPKRGMVAVPSMPAEVERKVSSIGCTISADEQYDMDAQ